MSRDYDQTIEQARRANEIDPNFGWNHAWMGLAYAEKGDFAQSLAAYEKATQLDPSPMLKAMKAHGYAVAGKRREAEKLLAEVKAHYKSSYLCAYEIAVTHVAFGEKDQAFEWLNRAVDDRADCIPFLPVDPRMDPIRADPRFQDLLERAGLVPRRKASVEPADRLAEMLG